MAEIITEPITLDISHPQQWVRIRIQQGDVNSKQIDVSITDDGDTYVIPQGSVVQLEMMKSDNLPIFNPCTVVNNNARFEISEQMTATRGMGVAKIKITDVSTGGTLHTVPFYIYCDEEVLNESIIVSTGEFTALTDALVQMSAYQLRFAQIGDLSLLQTTSNTDLVEAINENVTNILTKVSKGDMYYNVKDYGAKCNANHYYNGAFYEDTAHTILANDDYIAIQNCVNDVISKGGGSILFPKMCLISHDINIPYSKITLSGTGDNSGLVSLTTDLLTFNTRITNPYTYEKIGISNLRLAVYSAKKCINAVNPSLSDVNMEISDVFFDAQGSAGGVDCKLIAFKYANSINITNCKFFGSGYQASGTNDITGIYCEDVMNMFVSKCWFFYCKWCVSALQETTNYSANDCAGLNFISLYAIGCENGIKLNRVNEFIISKCLIDNVINQGVEFVDCTIGSLCDNYIATRLGTPPVIMRGVWFGNYGIIVKDNRILSYLDIGTVLIQILSNNVISSALQITGNQLVYYNDCAIYFDRVKNSRISGNICSIPKTGATNSIYEGDNCSYNIITENIGSLSIRTNGDVNTIRANNLTIIE